MKRTLVILFIMFSNHCSLSPLFVLITLCNFDAEICFLPKSVPLCHPCTSTWLMGGCWQGNFFFFFLRHSSPASDFLFSLRDTLRHFVLRNSPSLWNSLFFGGQGHWALENEGFWRDGWCCISQPEPHRHKERGESIDKGRGRKEGVVLVLFAQRRKDEPF